jgi:hypothetical protein
MSAELLISSLKDIKDNEKFNHYDESLCSDIHSRIDKSLKDNGYGIAEREKFVRNYFVGFVLLSKKELNQF